VLADDFSLSDDNRQSLLQALSDRFGLVDAGQARIEKGIIDLKHMSSALTERFDAVKEGIVELQQQAKETLEQVKRSEEMLRKAVFVATEIKTPTCFVILPHKLGARGETDDENAKDMHEHLLGIAGVCCNDDEEDEGESAAVQLLSLPDNTGKKPEGHQEVFLARARRKAKSVKAKMDKCLSSPSTTLTKLSTSIWWTSLPVRQCSLSLLALSTPLTSKVQGKACRSWCR